MNEEVIKRLYFLLECQHSFAECNIYCDPPNHAIMSYANETIEEFDERLAKVSFQKDFLKQGLPLYVHWVKLALEAERPENGIYSNGNVVEVNDEGSSMICLVETMKSMDALFDKIKIEYPD